MLLPNANTDLIILNFIMVQKWQIKWRVRVELNIWIIHTTWYRIKFYAHLCRQRDRFWFYCPYYFFEVIQRLAAFACEIDWKTARVIIIKHMLQMNHTQPLQHAYWWFDDNQFRKQKELDA